MRIWEKTYLLTVTIILLTLYGSLFFILNSSYRNNFRQLYDTTLQTEQTILSSVQSLFNANRNYDKLNLYCNVIKKQGISTAIASNGEIMIDQLPFSLDGMEDSFAVHNQIITDHGSKYLLLQDSFTASSDDVETEITVFYARSLDPFYQIFYRQMVSFLLTAALISILLMSVLYLSMKRIYRPVNNIAHELRTPLTAIQGYAQYILLGKLSDEDIHFASGQIHREAKYINEIIERLLAMEQLRNDRISIEKIDPDDLFQTVKAYYPAITIHNEMDHLMGDRTLILCLLLNLLSNISRSEGALTLTASRNEIRIHNQKDVIEPDLLQLLNKNRSIPKEKIHGKGLGVSLCHEIARLHHGTLRYESSAEEGTTVVVSFAP